MYKWIKCMHHLQGRIQVWADLARAPLLTTKSCKFSLFWGHISQISLNFDTRPPLFANPGSGPDLIWVISSSLQFSSVGLHLFLSCNNFCLDKLTLKCSFCCCYLTWDWTNDKVYFGSRTFHQNVQQNKLNPSRRFA